MRLYVQLSLATRIPFHVLEGYDDALIATYLEELDDREKD